MPRLRSVWWTLCDNEKHDLPGRRARRAAFAQAIPSLPASLHLVQLYFQYEVKDQRFEHPIPLISVEDDRDDVEADPLSVALGRLARRTQSFDLSACLSNTFWEALTTVAGENTTPPCSPVASILRVNYTDVSPRGQWVTFPTPLEGGREYSPDQPFYAESHAADLERGDEAVEDLQPGFCRYHPNPPFWNPILRESGRAVAHLPASSLLQVSAGDIKVCRVAYDASASVVLFVSYPFIPNAHCERDFPQYPPEPTQDFFLPDDDVLRIWRESTKAQAIGSEAVFKIINISYAQDEDWGWKMDLWPI